MGMGQETHTREMRNAYKISKGNTLR